MLLGPHDITANLKLVLFMGPRANLQWVKIDLILISALLQATEIRAEEDCQSDEPLLERRGIANEGKLQEHVLTMIKNDVKVLQIHLLSE